MNNVLVLGHTGKIGSAIYEGLSDECNVIGLNTKNFDATKLETIKNHIDRIKPDIVINCIVYSGMDKCESNPHTTFKINSLFPRYLSLNLSLILSNTL